MSVTRVPSLLEQSIKTNAAGLADEVRTQLGCASSADVAAALIPLTATTVALSAQNVTQTANIASISAALVTYTPLTTTAALTGALVVDINNLDLSLTQSIVTVQGTISGNLMKFEGWTSAPTSAPITADLWASVNITGSLYKLPVWIG